MKKKKCLKIVGIACAAMLAMAVFIGCGSDDSSSDSADTEESSTELSEEPMAEEPADDEKMEGMQEDLAAPGSTGNEDNADANPPAADGDIGSLDGVDAGNSGADTDSLEPSQEGGDSAQAE